MGGACCHGIHPLLRERQVSLVQMDEDTVVLKRSPEVLLGRDMQLLSTQNQFLLMQKVPSTHSLLPYMA